MIKFVQTQTRPVQGEIVTGRILNEAYRRGFTLSTKETTLRVNHVVESKYAPNGFYVIGVPVNKK
jgi:hypothetical protein